MSNPTNDPVIADNTVVNEWIYAKPPRTDAKVHLLTVHNVATHGHWYGELGQYFKAWCPMPKRNKQREKELGLL